MMRQRTSINGMGSNAVPTFARLLILLAALTWAGCESDQFGYYVSPEVHGRVLAADSREPLYRATVRRVVPVATAGEATPPKGSQLQTEARGVQTDPNGRFVLPAEKIVAPFLHRSWQSVEVIIECAGYESRQTNFSAAQSLEHPPGAVPEVNAGDILLEPRAR